MTVSLYTTLIHLLLVAEQAMKYRTNPIVAAYKSFEAARMINMPLWKVSNRIATPPPPPPTHPTPTPMIAFLTFFPSHLLIYFSFPLITIIFPLITLSCHCS